MEDSEKRVQRGFAAVRRAAAPLMLAARSRRYRSLSPAGSALSSKPAATVCGRRMMGQKPDRQTDVLPFHGPCSTFHNNTTALKVLEQTKWC